jgi:hypothetical protein
MENNKIRLESKTIEEQNQKKRQRKKKEKKIKEDCNQRIKPKEGKER